MKIAKEIFYWLVMTLNLVLGLHGHQANMIVFDFMFGIAAFAAIVDKIVEQE